MSDICQTVTRCTCREPFPIVGDGCNFCGRATVPGESICIGDAIPECERIALAALAQWQHRAELTYIAHQ